MQVDERFLGGLLDNVFSVFTNSYVAQRKSKYSLVVPFDEDSKCLFVSVFGGSDKHLIGTQTAGGGSGHVTFVDLVNKARIDLVAPHLSSGLSFCRGGVC